MGEIISIVSQKGGVGKTTTAVNLSASLATMGHKVLLVDLDPQGHVATSFRFGKYDIKAGIFELFTNTKKLNEIIHRTPVSGFDFIPSNIWSEDEEELAKVFHEKKVFMKKPFSILAYKYDFVFIDCPPSLGKLTFNALSVSDSLIIPMQCEFYALKALGKLLKLVSTIKNNYNPRLKYRGFLLTMVDLRSNLSRFVMERLKNTLDGLVFETTIPRNIRLAEVPFRGQPVILFDKHCKGSNSYMELAHELLNQNGTIESSLSRIKLKIAENY